VERGPGMLSEPHVSWETCGAFADREFDYSQADSRQHITECVNCKAICEQNQRAGSCCPNSL
jgi:hypothetical protein